MSTCKIPRPGLNRDGPELEQVVHTHPTFCRSGWPRGFGTLNPSPHSWICGLSQTVEPKPFRYATIQFQDRRGVASLLYRNQACRNRRSCVWTNALSDVLFLPARELWSSRMHLFYSPGANYEVEFGLFMLFLRRMLSVFLVSSCSQSPYTLLAFRAHSQITVPALAFTSKPGKPIEGEGPRRGAGGAS